MIPRARIAITSTGIGLARPVLCRLTTARLALNHARTASSTARKQSDQILTLSCPDRPGIVHAVTGILAQNDMNILDSQQYSDPTSEKFFMRVHFDKSHTGGTPIDAAVVDLQKSFADLAHRMGMELDVRPVAQKPRVMIMVSKIGHCIHDLVYKASTGQLPIDIPVIVSNHPDFAPLAATHSIPFHHLPVSKDTKAAQEAQILALLAEHKVDLIVLARYMQVLTPGLCSAMSGRIINIHHSFLPSFKGAKPYHQAYERGVKIIGATAHFVTADLDEGPIIEQRVANIDHAMGPKALVDEGSVVESQVLAAAVKWVAERKVLLNGTKTVVFN